MAEQDRPYRYDALIKQRERETDQAARRLALREREIAKLRKLRDRHSQSLKESRQQARPGEKVDLAMHSLQYGRGAVLRQALARSEMRIDQLQRDASARRAELVEARTRLKAAEKLRERLHDRIAERLAKAERDEIDEIAVLRHADD